MLFTSYSTFLSILAVIVIYNVVRRFFKHIFLRNVVLMLGNLLLILTLVKEHTFIVLSVLSLVVFFVGRLLQSKRRKRVLTSALTLIVILFSIRNYPYIHENLEAGILSFINAPILSVQKLGLSYILFRFVHFLVESYRGTIRGSNFMVFWNYILFFPTILAGPIDTYNNFRYWIGRQPAAYDRSLFLAGITRIFFGAIKTLAIVPILIEPGTDYSLLLNDYSPLLALSISLLAYTGYIYFDFAGYSDISIGTAYLIGIKTPENFENPYVSKSLSEFWKRWHITFSNFLKLYVFKPSINLFNSIINPKYRLTVTILAYLITFLICGLWHGDKINFVYWGLWHGVGLAINKVFAVRLKPKLRFSASRAYNVFSVALTFVYVSVGWMFFHYTHDQLIEIFNLLL
ncbi:MAG: MBOAT family O-acyltransferase [Bacteroidota bacterium]